MKKYIALFLIFALTSCFFGCNPKVKENTTSADASTEESVEKPISADSSEDEFGYESSYEVTESSEQSEETSDPKESIDAMTKDGFEVAVAYANWTDPKDVFKSALNAGMMNSQIGRHYPIFKFDTAEELEQFKLGFSDVLAMNHGYDEVPSLDQVTASYDEEFFAENTVVLVYVYSNSGSYRYDVSNVSMVWENFTVYIKEHIPEQNVNGSEICVTDDMAGWFVTLVVPDDTAEKFTKFDAVDYDTVQWATIS